MHHQRRLDRHGGAVAAVDPLDLAGDQAVADIADAGAAVAVDGRTEQSELAHLGHDLAVEVLVPVGLDHARHQLVLGIGAGAVAHHALFLGKLVFKQQRIFPLEAGGGPFAAGFPGHLPSSLDRACGHYCVLRLFILMAADERRPWRHSRDRRRRATSMSNLPN